MCRYTLKWRTHDKGTDMILNPFEYRNDVGQMHEGAVEGKQGLQVQNLVKTVVS